MTYTANGNGSNWRTIGVLVGFLIAIAGMMNQKIDSLYNMLDQKIIQAQTRLDERITDTRAIAYESRQWQDAYARGQIPSPSEPKLAAIEKMFAEVETQFKAFKERMIENETHTREAIAVNSTQIDHSAELIRQTREGLAATRAKESP